MTWVPKTLASRRGPGAPLMASEPLAAASGGPAMVVGIIIANVLLVAVLVSVGLVIRDVRRLHAMHRQLTGEASDAAGRQPRRDDVCRHPRHALIASASSTAPQATLSRTTSSVGLRPARRGRGSGCPRRPVRKRVGNACLGSCGGLDGIRDHVLVQGELPAQRRERRHAVDARGDHRRARGHCHRRWVDQHPA